MVQLTRPRTTTGAQQQNIKSLCIGPAKSGGLLSAYQQPVEGEWWWWWWYCVVLIANVVVI